jgi:hypothetical protein
MTKNGKNYMFDDSDDPGIIFIPRPWKLTGLVTDATHVLRVRLPTEESDTETLSGTIKGPAGPLKNWPFVLKRDNNPVDQASLRGITPNRFSEGNWLSRSNGDFLFRNIPRANYSIEVLLPGGKLVVTEDWPPPAANESGYRSEIAAPLDRTYFTEDPEELTA